MTPHIIRNERGQTSIKLAVSVQDDQNDSKDAPVSDNSVPPIKQTKINTQAIVGAGQSLLIGGYYYEQKSTDASGIRSSCTSPCSETSSRRRVRGPNAWSA